MSGSNADGGKHWRPKVVVADLPFVCLSLDRWGVIAGVKEHVKDRRVAPATGTSAKVDRFVLHDL